jgi:homotetrameric cytidine deaminase
MIGPTPQGNGWRRRLAAAGRPRYTGAGGSTMQDLFAAARAAFDHAYAPYSKFRVGAAVRGASGTVFAGANVEDVSYPEGNCAEASALAALVAAGERRIVEALVMAEGPALCTPCGGCRQRLAEFGTPEVPVHLCDPEGLRRTVTLGELLPLSFGLHARRAGTPSAPGAIDVIRSRRPEFVPRVGLILGSGLGGIAEALEDATAIDYSDLPGFPRSSIEGHAGRLVLGRLAGVAVACLQGRAHLYEGLPATAVAILPRTLKALGCETLILSNAAGALKPELTPGSVVLIEDHINLLGQNPLVGPNDAAVGPRFPDMSDVYDRALGARLREVAGRLGIDLPGGVYLATLGPSFETPAEIRAFRALGADLVGMSTVPEAISARHCGLKVLGLSIVTNLAAGLAEQPLSHAGIVAQAAGAAATVQRLLTGLLEELAHDPSHLG